MSKDLVVGINGNLEHLKQILDDDSSKYIREVFVAAPKSVAHTGRILEEDTTVETLAEIVTMCRAKDVDVNVIANCESDNVFGVTEFAKKAYEIGVEWITLADSTTIKNVAHHVPNLKINLSVFARVTTPIMAMDYVDMGVKRVNLPEFLNRDLDMIDRIVYYLKPSEAEVELYLNSKCVNAGYCPMAISHYMWKNKRDHKDTHDPFLAWCTGRRNTNSIDRVFTPLIRPEDKHLYDSLGIEHYKIASRTDTPERTIKLVTAYGERSFDGQFHELWSNVFNGESFPNKLLDGVFESVMHLSEEWQKEHYIKFNNKYIYKGGGT